MLEYVCWQVMHLIVELTSGNETLTEIIESDALNQQLSVIKIMDAVENMKQMCTSVLDSCN